MHSDYSLQLADKRIIDVTNVLESSFADYEKIWWLILIGRYYESKRFLLITKSNYPPYTTLIIRRFDLTEEVNVRK